MTDAHGDFAAAIASALSKGVQIVIVHGGGPQINAALESAGIDSKFVGGFRVTTPEIFEIVEKVLTHEVGPAIANSLLKIGVNAVAISGRTSESLIAEPQRKLVDGTPADLGLVGVITSVNPQAIRNALKGGQVPVISPIAIDEDFRGGLNVNADLAAAAIAGALDATVLVIMTDVAGIFSNWPDKESLIEEITFTELSKIKNSFADGMAPKVQACLDAINAGAQAVRIIDGTDSKSFELALNDSGGTLVTK